MCTSLSSWRLFPMCQHWKWFKKITKEACCFIKPTVVGSLLVTLMSHEHKPLNCRSRKKSVLGFTQVI